MRAFDLGTTPSSLWKRLQAVRHAGPSYRMTGCHGAGTGLIDSFNRGTGHIGERSPVWGGANKLLRALHP
jgi:hypothetical protein